MKSFFLIFAFLAIFKIQNSYSYPYYLYAYTNSNQNGYEGVPLVGGSGEFTQYVTFGSYITVEHYSCGCDFINVALRIDGITPSNYDVIGPGETVSIRAYRSGYYKIYVSNRCSRNSVFCRFEVNKINK